MRVRRREGTGRAIRAYPMGRSSPACCVKWLALRFVLNLYSHECSVETCPRASRDLDQLQLLGDLYDVPD